MNVYDAAHNLAKAIKESDELSAFKVLDKEIKSNSEVEVLLNEFQSQQMELQTMQMMGQELSEEKVKSAQELFEKISKFPKVPEYFQAEMRLNQLMGDVSKILGDAMDFRKDN